MQTSRTSCMKRCSVSYSSAARAWRPLMLLKPLTANSVVMYVVKIRYPMPDDFPMGDLYVKVPFDMLADLKDDGAIYLALDNCYEFTSKGMNLIRQADGC